MEGKEITVRQRGNGGQGKMVNKLADDRTLAKSRS